MAEQKDERTSSTILKWSSIRAGRPSRIFAPSLEPRTFEDAERLAIQSARFMRIPRNFAWAQQFISLRKAKTGEFVTTLAENPCPHLLINRSTAPADGYNLWAAHYDRERNPMLSLEQRILQPGSFHR